MRAIEASAPGKAVLCGEYAVLEGAPAISMAVDRRARVHVAATANDFHSVVSPGLHEEHYAFRTAAGGSLEWLNGAPAAGKFGLLEHVWPRVPHPLDERLALTLDTRAFFRQPGGAKLGFGSSAALGVALTAALAGANCRTEDLHRTAALAHRSFQGGKGSGVDVATAVHGGLIAFFVEQARVEKLVWPRDLHFALLWSGRPASTAEKLARLAAGPRHAASAGALADAAAAVHAAWLRGVAVAILESLGAYAAALQRFSNEHELGVFDAGHRELYDAAMSDGLVYKPCGAGGGDIGVVFAERRSAVADFAARAARSGFGPLPVRHEPQGVLCHSGGQR